MLQKRVLTLALAPLGFARPALEHVRALPSEVFNGHMTWYDREGGLGIKEGACGEINYSNQKIVALNKDQYVALSNSENPNNAAVCHAKIRIQHEGKEIEAQVTDRCDACLWGDIDGTQAVFNELVGGLGPGNVSVTWSFE
ncbi:RlpA-like double-psi beta-barrel-protein domain-containing protein-containing protein [Truncatella angustata]|uniref:RlpA-like double-psi beta-barrel-protein domain-containing protein-containing protein n=1 Tax=Truncatella angustata TaxID=152316 RepID=A0A9P8UQY3_9PEZI|nr:RlpA-like double-psi beta-barrel-protein domain-containing protein-containing protein [Truncatella angustata]KAH6656604.1 RlpA-like double-psi beta-barrel-protein domain-containing protein-containing protein [Truncatella angustata]KAH8201534.1 hypothetical protein TruAng_004305 [Truncatella angustata]